MPWGKRIKPERHLQCTHLVLFALARMQANAKTSWAAYVAGCLLVLSHERGLAFHDRHVAILVCSDVPEGAPLSQLLCAAGVLVG